MSAQASITVNNKRQSLRSYQSTSSSAKYRIPPTYPHQRINSLKDRKIQYICIEKDEHITSYYTMYKVLGKGTYGVVYAARQNRDNSVWAIKILTKKEGKLQKGFEKEIEILKFVDHPNIVKLNCIVESPTSVYMVLDLCDDVLSELFKSRKVMSEVDSRRIIKELASAVSYLHNNGIVHRDIKMQNILLLNDDSIINESKFTIKLTDFGLSTVKSGSSFLDMLHDTCGTLAYMAPEIIIKRSYSQQCDVWAIGVLLFALLSGEFPFAQATDNQIKSAIISEKPNFQILNVDSPKLDCVVHLIKRLLDKDPAHRSTAIEILDHPWIREQPLHNLKSGNVLDMMAQWRDELTIDTATGTSRQSNDLFGSKRVSVLTEKSNKGQHLATQVPLQQKARRSTQNSILTSSKLLQKQRKSSASGKMRLGKGQKAGSIQIDKETEQETLGTPRGSVLTDGKEKLKDGVEITSINSNKDNSGRRKSTKTSQKKIWK